MLKECRSATAADYLVTQSNSSLHSACVIDVTFQQKYREEFEKTKGKMIGLKGLQDDLNIAHSVHASKLQSDVSAFFFFSLLPYLTKTSQKYYKTNTSSFPFSLSRLNTGRIQRSSSRSSTCPWTWWRSPTPKRPSRWSVTRTIGSPCTSTPHCLTTWRCRRPRERTLCRARWEGQCTAADTTSFIITLLSFKKTKKNLVWKKKTAITYAKENITSWN